MIKGIMPTIRYYCLDIYLSLFTVGSLFFGLCALFPHYFWESGFFIWQSLCEGSFLAFASIFCIGSNKHKMKVVWFMVFAGIRFLFEPVVAIFHLDINNDWYVAVAFLLLISVASYLTLKEDAKPNKWLSKYLFKSD